MTDEEVQIAGEVEGLKIALRLLVSAVCAFDKGPEIIATLRRSAFDVSAAASRVGAADPVAQIFDRATREALEFIFSAPEPEP